MLVLMHNRRDYHALIRDEVLSWLHVEGLIMRPVESCASSSGTSITQMRLCNFCAVSLEIAAMRSLLAA